MSSNVKNTIPGLRMKVEREDENGEVKVEYYGVAMEVAGAESIPETRMRARDATRNNQ